MTAENAQNRYEFEAAMQADSFRKQLGDTPLLDLIRKGLSAAQTERQAEGQAQTFDPKSYLTGYANRVAPDQRIKTAAEPGRRQGGRRRTVGSSPSIGLAIVA